MKVFAPGAYHHGNRGDAALVMGFVEWIHGSWPDAEITITSFRPESDQAALGIPAIDMVTRPETTLTRVLVGVLRRTPLIGKQVLSLFHIAFISLVLLTLRGWTVLDTVSKHRSDWLLPDHVKRNVDEIRHADAIITIPGGYLIAQRWTDTLWLYHLPTLMLAHWLRKDVVIGPCSFGPFSGPSRKFAMALWKMANRIYLREVESLEIAQDMDLDLERAISTRDLAFLLTAAKEESSVASYDTSQLVALREQGRALLGVSAREYHFPNSRNVKHEMKLYQHGLVDAIEILVSRYGDAIPVIVAQTEEDELITRTFFAQLEQRGIDALIITDASSPQALLAIYENLHVMVGTRMHANILSLNCGVPVVAIAYEPKTLGILRTLGLEDWSLPITDVAHTTKVRDMLLDRWSNRERAATLAAERVSDARSRLIVDARSIEIEHELATSRRTKP
ncbi:colanic acid biosynthesis protein [Mycobacteroides abscessus subsp. abscessus]|nr:colanic acid biosynthesis protein [Mycobacteroides abscessus subsp. abscessus]